MAVGKAEELMHSSVDQKSREERARALKGESSILPGASGLTQ